MRLSEQHKDALTELINISFARTASSLSELTGHRVLLEVPHVSMHPISELGSRLADFIQGDVATVQQLFTGSISGNALLLLNYEGAVELTDLLLPSESRLSHRLDSARSEVLTEIGNILLNACLGMFGNLLHIKVSFSVPRLHLEALDGLLSSIIIGKDELRYALVVSTTFRVRGSSVTGYLMLVLGVASLECLVNAVEVWADIPVPSLPESSNNSEIQLNANEITHI